MRNTYNILSFLMSVTCTSMYPTVPMLLIQPLKKQEEEQENSRCFFTKLSYSSKDAGFAFFSSSSSSLSSLFSCYFFHFAHFLLFFLVFSTLKREKFSMLRCYCCCRKEGQGLNREGGWSIIERKDIDVHCIYIAVYRYIDIVCSEKQRT